MSSANTKKLECILEILQIYYQFGSVSLCTGNGFVNELVAKSGGGAPRTRRPSVTSHGTQVPDSFLVVE